MFRIVTYTVLGVIAVALGYGLFFTGGQGHGASFSAGNLHVEYRVIAPGVLRRERLEYVVLSDGRWDEETIHAADGKDTSFSRIYRDAGRTATVAFTAKPGQTIWIGKDRMTQIAPTPLRMSDLQLMEKHGGSGLMQITSLDELRTVIAKLKSEPNDGPTSAPARSVGNAGAAEGRPR